MTKGELTEDIPKILIHVLIVSKRVLTPRSHESQPLLLLLESLHLHQLIKSGHAARRPTVDGLAAAIIAVQKLTTTPILTKPSGIVHARPPEKPIPIPTASFFKISQKRRVVDRVTPTVKRVWTVHILTVRKNHRITPPTRAHYRLHSGRRLVKERQFLLVLIVNPTAQEIFA